ncbi:MAG: HEAT repeat domain-containing protein [Methanoregula sp.]|nr:HEAT repeat domain-containing protein [Methanoregula sp.]
MKKLRETRNVQGLILALQHKDPTVQYGAAEALGEIGDARAVEPLIAVLKHDETSGVRWKAAEALSKIGIPAVTSLIGALQHDDEDVRWKAAIALGEIGDPMAIPPLIHLLCDEDRYVKSRAANALSMIGEPAVDPLICALREGDGNLRWGAAMALGKIRNPRAIEPLIRALPDKYENVRAEAASALAAIGEPALEPLLHFLKYSDGAARLEVVTALGELRDTGAIQPLIQLLENANDDERKAIADALDAILVPSVKPIILKLRNENLQTNEKTR